jgi:Dihydroxynaphthoic acid synthase
MDLKHLLIQKVSVEKNIKNVLKRLNLGCPLQKLGLVYHPDGIRQFIEVIGISKAKELFFTARAYTADQAKEMGVVDYLISEDALSSFTYEMAGDIVSNAPLSLKGAKKIFNMLTQSSHRLSDEHVREAEQLIRESFNSEDLKEGQMAFIEKRKPCFKGK